MSNLTLETLYAQPDGKFRSNEKYDKILAEIAKKPPFKKDTGIRELSEPSRYKELKALYENYESTEAIQDFTNDLLLMDQPFDVDTWQALVTDVTVSIAGDSRIAVYQFHFYELEKNFKQLTHISGVDILDMYVVIFLTDLKLYKGYKTILNKNMYHFIQRHLELSDDILVKAKYWLAKYSEMADIQLFMQHLFPIELNINKEDIKTDIYRDNYTIFFYDLPKFIKVYYECNELTEAELLWFISNAPEMLVHFKRSIYLKRGHLTILRRFHNTHVLNLWLRSFGANKYLENNWLDKYPLFTIVRLLENDKDHLVKNYLKKNLLVLKPLQELLQEKNNTDALSKLQEITQEFTAKEIAQAEIDFNNLPKDKKALNALKRQNKKPSATTKTQTKTAKLKWLTLPLQRFEHTDTCNPKYLGKKASFELSEWGRKTFDIFYKYDWCDFSSTIVDMYERTKDIDKSEHQILQANFDKLSLQQRYLCMFVKASVIVAHYADMLTGEYKLTANDYIHLDLTNHIGLKTFSPEDLITLTLSKTDEQHDKILFQADFPFNDYIGTRKQTKSVIPLLEAYVRVCGDAGIAKALEVMDKLHDQRLEFLPIAQAIDSPVIVPYLLKNMHYTTDDYMKKYLTTVIDEVVYLSFTKQTDSLLKKAKTNAKKLFNDLAINHSKELIKSLKEYDKQLDKPVLVEFLNNYIEFYNIKDKNQILAEQQP